MIRFAIPRVGPANRCDSFAIPAYGDKAEVLIECCVVRNALAGHPSEYGLPRTVPSFLLALGSRPLPSELRTLEETFLLRRVFKNDFFAATALYEGSTRKIVLKIGRQAPFLLIPLRWIGRFLAAREASALLRLRDLEGIPQYLGAWEDTGILRAYIEGRPLQKGDPVPDDFHGRLRELIRTIHGRGMAYVDLEKCENVLLGHDGQPYLFDFQISWYLSPRRGGELWAARRLRAWLQAGDEYHLVKLQRRTRPDQLSPAVLQASYAKPWVVRAYTRAVRPLTRFRRGLLQWLDPRRHAGERGRIVQNER